MYLNRNVRGGKQPSVIIVASQLTSVDLENVSDQTLRWLNPTQSLFLNLRKFRRLHQSMRLGTVLRFILFGSATGHKHH